MVLSTDKGLVPDQNPHPVAIMVIPTISDLGGY